MNMKIEERLFKSEVLIQLSTNLTEKENAKFKEQKRGKKKRKKMKIG